MMVTTVGRAGEPTGRPRVADLRAALDDNEVLADLTV
jgi:hypothetical protein